MSFLHISDSLSDVTQAVALVDDWRCSVVFTANNISQMPVVTSAMAIGAQPYWSVAACSGKIRLAKHITVTTTEANMPNADSILGIYLDLKNR